MPQELENRCKKAADLLRSFPTQTRVRVVSHYDADGIAAAGILCSMLYDLGFHFHATLMRNPFNKGLDRILNETNDLIIFSDMGSGQLETIEKLHHPVIIFDHHQYLKKTVPDHIIQINAHLCGYDGNYEACGATLCYAFAEAMDAVTARIASLALAGATGDKQYLGGYRGYNAHVVDSAVQHGFVKESVGVKLSGNTLADALFFSIDPFYKGISGNKTSIQTLLKNLGITANKAVHNLSDDEKKKLHSYLVYSLVKAGCQQNIITEAVRKRYWSEVLGCELERFADLLDACGKFHHRSLGLALCLGDGALRGDAEKVEQQYKQKILDALLELEKNNAHERQHLRYFYSTDSSLGGVIGGIAVNYVFDDTKPLFSLAKTDDEIHVSCRGNQDLVKRGLDLGLAMNTVSKDLGGYGGGHKIAAGATIALQKENEFLEKTDQLLGSQMKGDQ